MKITDFFTVSPLALDCLMEIQILTTLLFCNWHCHSNTARVIGFCHDHHLSTVYRAIFRSNFEFFNAEQSIDLWNFVIYRRTLLRSVRGDLRSLIIDAPKKTGKVIIVGERLDLFNYNVIADSARDFCFFKRRKFSGDTILLEFTGCFALCLWFLQTGMDYSGIVDSKGMESNGWDLW